MSIAWPLTGDCRNSERPTPIRLATARAHWGPITRRHKHEMVRRCDGANTAKHGFDAPLKRDRIACVAPAVTLRFVQRAGCSIAAANQSLQKFLEQAGFVRVEYLERLLLGGLCDGEEFDSDAATRGGQFKHCVRA